MSKLEIGPQSGVPLGPSAGPHAKRGPISRGLRLLALFAAPAFFLVVSAQIVDRRGPLHLGSNSDPSYVYLVNSLAVAEGVTPRHVDHPGTPVQLVGATWIRLGECLTLDGNDCARRVFARSEAVLSAIVAVQSSLLAGLLLLGGGLIMRETGSTGATLVWQWIPLASPSFAFESVEFKPEPWLLAIVLLLSIEMALRFSGGRNARAALVGVLSGALVATKVTAFPVALIAVLGARARGGRDRVLVWFTLGAMMWVAPAAGALGEFARFLWRSAFGAGTYGRGETPRVDLAAWFSNVARLARDEPTLALASLLIASSAGWYILARGRKSNHPEVRFLFSVAAAALVYFLAGGFQPRSRYLIPLLGIVGLALLVAAKRLLEESRRSVVMRAVLIALSMCALLMGWRDWNKAFARLDALKSAAERAAAKAEQLPPGAIVFEFYGSSSKSYALWMGANYFGQRYGHILSEDARRFMAVVPRQGEVRDFNGLVDSERWADSPGPFLARGRVPVRREIAMQLEQAFRTLGFTLPAGSDWLTPDDCRIECLYELDRAFEARTGHLK